MKIIQFNGLKSIKEAVLIEKDKVEYYEDALKVSTLIKENLKRKLQHLKGDVTFQLAIPHNFFVTKKITGKINNELAIAISNLPLNLKAWIY